VPGFGGTTAQAANIEASAVGRINFNFIAARYAGGCLWGKRGEERWEVISKQGEGAIRIRFRRGASSLITRSELITDYRRVNISSATSRSLAWSTIGAG